MKFHLDLHRLGPLVGLAALLAALAGCQSGSGGLFGSGGAAEEPVEQVEQIDLSVYCPRVELRQGTAFYNTYERARGEEDSRDRARIIYQASISDVTRSCRYENGQLHMTVAVAGKVILGPKGKPGTITMPIRIAVLQGEEVLYSQLHRYKAQVEAVGATQFVFSDPAIVVPAPSQRNVRILAGFDEGPYDTP